MRGNLNFWFDVVLIGVNSIDTRMGLGVAVLSYDAYVDRGRAARKRVHLILAS